MLTSIDEQHENGQQTKNDPHFLLFGNLVTVRSDFRPLCNLATYCYWVPTTDFKYPERFWAEFRLP
jgi:hypothetical protein